MVSTAASIFAETMRSWGVEVVFGRPSEEIFLIIQALTKRQIRLINVQHEEAAALMAGSYALVTGRLGVCLASSGAGALRLLQGLMDARANGQAVLAVTGAASPSLTDSIRQHGSILEHLFSEVTRYNTVISSPNQVEALTNLAVRAALSERSTAYINFPTEIQSQFVKAHKPRRDVSYNTTTAFAQRVRLAYENDLRRAAEILNTGKRVAILAGRGATGGVGDVSAELEYLAGMLAAPVVKTVMGKTALPDTSEYSAGILGAYGTQPALDAIKSCDTLFIIGSFFRYSEFLPRPDRVRIVQLDLEPTHIGLHISAEVGLVGDYQRTLKQLLPLLEHHTDRSFLEKIQKSTQQWWKEMEACGTDPAVPLKPQVVAWELGKLLPEDAILACDPGLISAWWSRLIPAKSSQKHLFSGNLESSGSALPYAIAAQAAEPGRLAVAFMEEQGFNTHLAEFTQCAINGLPVKVILMKKAENRVEKRAKKGRRDSNPQPGSSLDYTQFAAASNASSWTIRAPAECAGVLSQALSTPCPALIIAEVDPIEKPVKWLNEQKEQSQGESIIDSSGREIDLNDLVEKMRELL